MKNKILYSIMAFVMALFIVGCSDDTYTAPTTPMLTDGSVVTGTADVTPTSAIINGSVKGLDDQSASAYKVGFYYGSAEDDLSNTVDATSGSEFSATVSGMPGEVIYYQAYVTLQGRLTYKGDIKSLILTDAKAITGEYNDLTANSVKLSGASDKFTEESKGGIVLSGVGTDAEGNIDAEKVRAGVKIEGATPSSYDIEALGLVPGTTYYYTAYLDLGAGIVYGEVKSFTTPAKAYDENDFVDLGLTTKWAKCNIGASKESELGGHFGFGDLTGYNTSIDPADYASTDIYGTPQDLASKVYDQKATVPTIDEIEELFSCTTVEWTTVDGVEGYKFTGKGDYSNKSIFLPAAGSRVQGTTTGAGTEGRYLTGSINATDAQYAQTFLFTQNNGYGRTSTPVYQALSVRAVSVQKKIALDKSKLYKTWEIDCNASGVSQVFTGPVSFYGPNASWRSITNKEQTYKGSDEWDPAFGDISWYLGSDASVCQGYLTLNEDGSCEVKDAAGNVTAGTYVVDENYKTIKLTGVTMLHPTTMTNVDFSTIRILKIDDNSVVLSGSRDGDGEQVALNMLTTERKNGFNAKLTCYSGDTYFADASEQSAEEWRSANVTVFGGTTGTYTVTFNANGHARTNGKVYVLDIEGFATKYPNAVVVVDKIEADGVEVPFDQNKFYFGDIENKGNYRIEMANIWGCGHNSGWNGLADTPFKKGGGETTNETALAFSSTFTVTFSVVSLDAISCNVSMQMTNNNWGGFWGPELPNAAKVVRENNQFKVVGNNDNGDEVKIGADGSVSNVMVAVVDVKGLANYFKGATAQLKSVVNDGNTLTFDATKIQSYKDGENTRVELFSCYGKTKDNCPWPSGTTTIGESTVVTDLNCTTSTSITINNFKLFALPEAWNAE